MTGCTIWVSRQNRHISHIVVNISFLFFRLPGHNISLVTVAILLRARLLLLDNAAELMTGLEFVNLTGKSAA